MGGRMSGESPREEKVEGAASIADVERPYQTKGADDTVTPTLVRQRSRQQPMVCWTFGQHAFPGDCAGEVTVTLQSGDISGVAVANATREPCKPMANITMTAISWRLMN
jgi:hypothetical protein